MESKPEHLSIQGWINENGEYDPERMNIYLEDTGLTQLESPISNNLHKISHGDRIAYVIKDQYGSYLFRSGGILLSQNYNPETQEKYILFKGFNQSVISLQVINLELIFYRSKDKKEGQEKKEKIYVFKLGPTETKFPVTLSKDGQDVIVYYAKDNSKRTRYMSTQRFKDVSKSGKWRVSKKKVKTDGFRSDEDGA